MITEEIHCRGGFVKGFVSGFQKGYLEKGSIIILAPCNLYSAKINGLSQFYILDKHAFILSNEAIVCVWQALVQMMGLLSITGPVPGI